MTGTSTFSEFYRRRLRGGLVLGVALLFVAGAAWRVAATDAGPAGASTKPTTVNEAVAPVPHALAGEHESYADVVSMVAPAVVTIRVETSANIAPTGFQVPDEEMFRRFFGDRFPGQFPNGPQPPRRFRQGAQGSGVIVSEDGYILTNHHVVDHADKITVELTDGRSMGATLVGTDEPSDLALLKVDAPDLHALPLGDSDTLRVGDVVLAVGNPLGVGQTVTMGIISAKGRSTGAGDGGYEDFLQTDAPINHGNSGGALVSTAGELIGINAQILSNTDGNIGIGFAIPANMARHVMDQLRTGGRVVRAQLGVTAQVVTSDIAESLDIGQVGGAIISAVTPGSAADRAGLERGDVITMFNGEPVTDTNSLRNRVALASPGSEAHLTIVRDGREQEMNVELDEAAAAKRASSDADPGPGDQTALGVTVSPLTPELAPRLGLRESTQGLVVQDVAPGSRAADAGIQPGDVIEEVNRTPVRTVDELRKAVSEITDRPLLLVVNREGRSLFVAVAGVDG